MQKNHLNMTCAYTRNSAWRTSIIKWSKVHYGILDHTQCKSTGMAPG